jgi:hypothetical protein
VVEKLAVPLIRLTVVPGPPSIENVTLPVGVELPLPATVAVKVTNWPIVLGLADEVTVVVVAILLTFCVSDPELVVKLTSPL